ncbi:TPA: 30S ribosomal protein S3 [candidate division CPR2 bacterium]|nr:MAG: 30S ribosomal protein S3 [candidate division CPR2 bacterium GW2011_GWD1_39_7]OGB70306.1 MAG: 30S ribosomal protein S3 [candidate division CPR2 bacterium GWD2_39_7]HBG81325.1 30S ribosomal protein S3 [candidate division CPR2 bacterium]HCL99700.1 30S ribosomal protein S3 [candidate division CPR2 bacterium]
MGQKVNPTSFRLQLTRNWQSRWFVTKDYTKFLHEDIKIRGFIMDKYGVRGGIARVDIERSPSLITVAIHSSKPGVIIGRGGVGIEELKKAVSKIVKTPIKVNIEEIRSPELFAKLVADNIAGQLERRIAFKRATKQAIDRTMKAGAKGIKVTVAGRLGGVDIARSDTKSQGKIPLQTIKADVDYALSKAKTTYGIIGVKVWIYKGDL